MPLSKFYDIIFLFVKVAFLLLLLLFKDILLNLKHSYGIFRAVIVGQ